MGRLLHAPTRKLLIPTYPFQRSRCWSESRQTRLSRLTSTAHPLLGESNHGANKVWQNRIDLRLQSYLSDHKVRGACVYPAAAIIESAIAAAFDIHSSETIQFDRFRILNHVSLLKAARSGLKAAIAQIDVISKCSFGQSKTPSGARFVLLRSVRWPSMRALLICLLHRLSRGI